MNRATVFGFLLAIAFVVLSAGRDVKAENLNAPLHLFLLLAFLPTALPAAAWSAARPAEAGGWSRAAIRAALLLNLATLVNWVAYFYSIHWIGSVLFAGIVVGLMPTMVLLLEAVFHRRVIRIRDCAAAFVVVLGVLLVASGNQARNVEEEQRDAAKTGEQKPAKTAIETGAQKPAEWLGIVLAVATAFTSAAANILVRELQVHGVGPIATFGVRFWATILFALTFALMAAAVEPAKRPTPPDEWTTLVLIGLVGIALALFFLQSSIRLLGPATPTLLFAFHPACVLLFKGSSAHPSDWLGIALIVVGVIAGLKSARAYRPAGTAPSH